MQIEIQNNPDWQMQIRRLFSYASMNSNLETTQSKVDFGPDCLLS